MARLCLQREPLPLRARLNGWKRASAALILMTLATASASSGAGRTVDTVGGAPGALAEAALARLASDDPSGAARLAGRALEAAPENSLLYNLAGAVRLRAGDASGAQQSFARAVAQEPDDALARYGMGLSLLAQRHPGEARVQFEEAARRGGRPSLLLARAYAQWLEGAQIEVGGAFVPDPFVSTQQAVQGMSYLRRGEWSRAADALQEALGKLAGSSVREPEGILFTFDASSPLRTVAQPLPAGIRLDPPPPPDAGRAFRGEVRLEAEGLPSNAAYVGFEADGKSLSIANVRPFAYTWNTRTARDGWHTVAIVGYDAQAREISRTERRLLTRNPARDLPGRTPEQTAQLEGAVWNALTPRPARSAVGYALGSARRALGQPVQARDAFWQAAALRPDWGDVNAQLRACGGIEDGGSALWGVPPKASEKVVALTFDDGPKPGHTERLLEILKKYDARATFFVIGRHVAAHPELARLISGAGHEIANHSFSHPNLTRLVDNEVAREILRTQIAVKSATGQSPRFLRPPGGQWNARVAQITRSWGLTPCMWTVDAYGAEVQGAQNVANVVLTQVRPGSILLMHNGKASTLMALPTILRELKRRGYAFVTVDQIAGRAGQFGAGQAPAGGSRIE